VRGESGLGVVWPVERIASDNASFRVSFRDVYMPFDALVFFADAGNGDQFAFPVTSTGARDDVFVRDHENDSRTWFAPSLRLYLAWWLTGERARSPDVSLRHRSPSSGRADHGSHNGLSVWRTTIWDRTNGIARPIPELWNDRHETGAMALDRNRSLRQFSHGAALAGATTRLLRPGQATPASRKARLSLSISRAITSRCTSWVPS
jgi:hypothetical protein